MRFCKISGIFNEFNAYKNRKMSVFGTNEELIGKISSELKRLKQESMTASELDALVGDARELYERLIVLRYKAFEQTVKKSEIPQETVEQSISVEPTPELKVEPIEPAVEEPETDMGFAFQLFDEPETVEAQEPVVHFEPSTPEPPKVEETVQPELVLGEQPVKQPAEAQSPSSLLEKLSEQHNQNRLADKLKLSPIASLKSTFTLNDRIRFSQGLFSGDSEQFRLAVDILDSCDSLDAAKNHLAQYATTYTWDMESKDVEHFYEFIERRFMA
jgi:type IV secretory pathway VirB10-like protein